MGELAVEFGEQRNTAGEAKLGALRHERGILCRRRARQRLERRGERGITDPVVRPGHARAQGECGLGVEQQQTIEASAQFFDYKSKFLLDYNSK